MFGSSNSQSKKIIEISYIGCKQIEEETKNWGFKQKNSLKEFSFKLQLLSTIDQDVCDITQSELKSLTDEESKPIISQVQKVLKLFKTCLHKNKNFTGCIKISKASEELHKKYLKTKVNQDNTIEEFIRTAPYQILLRGVTIKLRINVKDINLSGLQQFEADFKEKLKQAKNKEQSQIVPVIGSFGCNLTDSGKQVIRAPVVVEAMRSNFHWVKSLFLPSSLLNIIRYLDHQRIPKPQKQLLAITYYPEQQEAKQDEVIGEENSDLQTSKNLNTPNGTNSSKAEENQEEKKDITTAHTLTQMEKNRTENEHTSTKRKFMQIVKKFLQRIRIKNNPKKTHTTADHILAQAEENRGITAEPTLTQAEEKKDITAEPALTEVVENQEEKEHITIKPTFIQRIERSIGIINDDDIQAQEIIKRAKNYAETEMIFNESKANARQKTLDEIFCETVIAYYDTRYPKFLMEIIESVFKTIFLKEISKKPEILEEDVLNTLKNFGLEFNKDYLLQQIGRKQDMLYDSIKLCSVPNKPKNKIQSLYKSIKGSFTTYNAQKKAQDAIKNNNDKTLDEIFIEVMKNYTDQDRGTFICIFDKVFNIIFCGKKNPSKIETFEEIFNILKILEVQFDVQYFQDRVWDKKTKLSELVLDKINSQPTTEPKNTPSSNMEENQTPYTVPAAKAKKAKTTPTTDTAFKSSLNTVFTSKEGYACVFVIASSISILCLWHLPLGKVSILQGLVPKEKRELAGLILNILLIALIVALVLNLIHYVYSEYRANNIGKKTPPVTHTPFKSSLSTVFSSKKGYLSVFAIASSISILCLWHLPLGEVPILQGLLPEETREFAGLILNILLLTLIVLLVLGLAYYIHSEYKAHNIGSVEEIDIENPIEESKFQEQP
ncbi:hypothetical protein [Wolbachia endosymbiont of Folsomia candida]|uniref:hypothetical protein n=1 Tax=Wolbachia endosymbiont of Folsomia candida TaxID=169402 RepID=UPI000DBF34FD|nr:hypothetical protein [Wolbachia endosymbiont of Folsomia candida]AWW50876.1 hypothetical protein ASM33_08510 [Wolbachia endosymbiont of Folsomia candida]